MMELKDWLPWLVSVIALVIGGLGLWQGWRWRKTDQAIKLEIRNAVWDTVHDPQRPTLIGELRNAGPHVVRLDKVSCDYVSLTGNRVCNSTELISARYMDPGASERFELSVSRQDLDPVRAMCNLTLADPITAYLVIAYIADDGKVQQLRRELAEYKPKSGSEAIWLEQKQNGPLT